MPLVINTPLPLPCTWWKLKQQVRFNPQPSPLPIGVAVTRRRRSSLGFNAIFNSSSDNNSSSHGDGSTWCFFNPAQDPIVKEALKEPVAFFGGMFAGILRLDLKEEPLKEWVTRTVEAAGISEDETDAAGSATEAAPQEIEIE